jgi:hypothetical protein
MTEFDKKQAIFSDAIDRQVRSFLIQKMLLCIIYYYQINLLQEPQHPVWKIILLKQCCGLNSKYLNAKITEYQWFQQTPFLHFCPNSYLNEDEINKFEQTFEIKYSPQGPCLPLVNNELKIELILISISLGFSVLLMLLTWLFIWQNRLTYLDLLENILQKQKKNSIIKGDPPLRNLSSKRYNGWQ